VVALMILRALRSQNWLRHARFAVIGTLTYGADLIAGPSSVLGGGDWPAWYLVVMAGRRIMS